MTEVIDPGTVAPAVPPVAVAPVVPASPPTAPVVKTADLPEDALKARLEQAERAGQKKLLDSLGITDPAAAKAALDTVRAAEESKKSNETKLAEQALAITSMSAALDVAVNQTIATLTPEQKSAVDTIAGTDKAAWLRTYGALASTWKTAPAAAGTPVIAALPIVAPTALPATTSPVAGAPLPAGSISPPDIKATHQTLLLRNPIVAAAFAEQNSKAIYG